MDQLVSKSVSGNNATIRSAQSALNQADKSVVDMQKEITVLSTERDSLNAVGISKNLEIETNGDIGTFVYIAKILGTNLDTVVKWFTLVIVLVFDPLAVALVIAINFLIKNNTVKTPMQTPQVTDEEPYTIYKSTPPDVVQVDTPNTELPLDTLVEIPTEVVIQEPITSEILESTKYMSPDEVESLLEKWWLKRNGRT
jgi:hypothetical protein